MTVQCKRNGGSVRASFVFIPPENRWLRRKEHERYLFASCRQQLHMKKVHTFPHDEVGCCCCALSASASNSSASPHEQFLQAFFFLGPSLPTAATWKSIWSKDTISWKKNKTPQYISVYRMTYSLYFNNNAVAIILQRTVITIINLWRCLANDSIKLTSHLGALQS